MRNFKVHRIRRMLVCLAAACFIFCFMFVLPGQRIYADDSIALTVKGDGVGKTVEFTLDDLRALPQKTYTYSGYNHWPSLVVFKDMKGPSLKDILAVAGLKDNAMLIRVSTVGGAYCEFTKEQLLIDQRYYFPDAQTVGDVVDWPPKRSEDGKIPVETIFDPDETGGKLLYGQIAPNEPTCCKNQELEGLAGGTIEVLTTPLEKWEAPQADVVPGHVAPGTKVTLQHEDGTPYSAIVYYTLDGSEPTYGSNILNISYPSFQPQMNKPVTVDKNMTIKTRTIGMGKLDSDVVTLRYYITDTDTDGNTGNTGNVKDTENQENTGSKENNPKTANFADVENHWARDAINFLVQKGIISGVTDNEFKPEEKVTRAQFAKFLVGALGIETVKNGTLSFKDVPDGSWYHDYVAAAVNNGLITGYSGDYFAPDENISREQMAVIISRALKLKASAEISDDIAGQVIGKFNDNGSISSWARQGAALVVNRGIMNGVSEGVFAPEVSATRAETSVIIMRLYNQLNVQAAENK